MRASRFAGRGQSVREARGSDLLARARIHQVATHRGGGVRVRLDDRDLNTSAAGGDRLKRSREAPGSGEGAKQPRWCALEHGRGNEAEHARTAPHRRDIQVSRAPDAAIDVLPGTDPNRRKHARNRA